jgi:hypothetical protein
VLQQIEKRFEVALPYAVPTLASLNGPITNSSTSEFPKEGVDASTYMAA